MKQKFKAKQNSFFNNKGFIFIDLLLAITMSIIIATFIFSCISLFTFYYTLHQDQLAVYEIISQIPSFLHQKQMPTMIKKEKKEFYIDYTIENIEHTTLYKATTLPLLSIQVHWNNFYDRKMQIATKVFHEAK
jgi:hypothetical protein